ncbi:hypothetical protein SAMN05216188_12582 [Lentzea xinjiangensis]|uniref:HEAT repeat-containing protein n=1 Tax=Lentzea xinjiangensis TaxID=402600 RepID=A0A1H9VB25_9PSEU|nr:hypothetical protein SAMN05216188_12582 [Lentzea xinjiangensis]
MLAIVTGDDEYEAADALLSLVYYDPDGVWLEGVLLGIIGDPGAAKLHYLAVVCLGHVARLHRAVDEQVTVPLLERLRADPKLGGVAETALMDIDVHVRGDRTSKRDL